MPVFISHRTADDVLAARVFAYLTGQGILCYLDNLDKEAHTTSDITVTVR